jgi:hypothetical protein
MINMLLESGLLITYLALCGIVLNLGIIVIIFYGIFYFAGKIFEEGRMKARDKLKQEE